MGELRPGRARGRLRPIPRGFTLVELMVTIIVLAILLGIAVPSFRDASLSSRLAAYSNDLVASAHLARSEAIKRNAPVTLCASEDGATCAADDTDWIVGWIVITDDGALLQRQEALPPEFRFIEDDGESEIVFPATVVGVNPVRFTVCRAEPEGSQERFVTVTVSGAASVAPLAPPEDDGDCPD
jgi:type IV fimbrial biogenesis protein FimT